MAICIRCGIEKAYPLEVCAACGFTPVTSEQMAKSLILSETFVWVRMSLGGLRTNFPPSGARIRAGIPYQFDPSEVLRVGAAHDAPRATTSCQLVIDGIRWLGPPVLFLTGLYWLLSLS